MKKNAIALLLAVFMVSGSIGAVPVSAAEPTGQEETGEESAESTGQEEAGEEAVESTGQEETGEEGAELIGEEPAHYSGDVTTAEGLFEMSTVKDADPDGRASDVPDEEDCEDKSEASAAPTGFEWKTAEGSIEAQSDYKEGTQTNASENKCGENATWTISSGKLTISGKGAISDYNQTDAPWHSQSDSITSIVIGSGITRIGSSAFWGLSNVKSVTIPATVSELGDYAFVDCTSITSVKLPDAVKTLPCAAFGDCASLTSVKMSGVTKIEDYAFQGTAIKEFVLGKNLKSLSDYALFGTSIASYKVEAGNTAYSAANGVLYSADGTKLVAYPAGSTRTSFSIPSKVKSVEPAAFIRNNALVSVKIPEGVTSLKDSAFQEMYRLESIALPDSLTEVGNYVFYGCSSLQNISFGKGLSSTGYQMFYSCSSLETLSADNFGGLTCIEGQTFGECTSLKEVTLPDSIEVLGNGVFGNCYSLTSFSAPSLKCIPFQTFLNDRSLTDVNLGEGLTHIYRYTFKGCNSLAEITLPASTEYVDPDAFNNDTVVHVKNPDLEPFGNSGFRKLDKLTVTGTRNYNLAFSVLSLVNKERAKQGLGALSMESSLLETAMVRAAETVVLFSHTRPDGSSCFRLNPLLYGENIAALQSSAQSVMDSWMNSEGHKANILSDSYTSIGIGCFEADDGGYYWVQCFGTEKVSGNCKKPANKAVSQTVSIAADPFDEAVDGNDIIWGELKSYEYSLELSGNNRMTPGSTQQLYAFLQNTGGSFSFDLTGSNVVYSSSDNNIATVSSTGKVTAKSAGTTTITASTPKGRFSKKLKVTVVTTGWQTIDGEKYYFNKDGTMHIGWLKYGGEYYYFRVNGVMHTGSLKKGGKYFYFRKNGTRLSGWLQVGGKIFYYKLNGERLTGWLQKNGKKFYFRKNGEMHTGWLKLNGKYYYFKENGQMVTGRYKIGNKWFTFDSNGVRK